MIEDKPDCVAELERGVFAKFRPLHHELSLGIERCGDRHVLVTWYSHLRRLAVENDLEILSPTEFFTQSVLDNIVRLVPWIRRVRTSETRVQAIQ